MAFHITIKENLDSILSKGIEPRIGRNSIALGETENRVYCFIDKKSMEEALMNWMGEIYEELEDEGEVVELVIIEVCDKCLEFVFDDNGDVFFECYSYKTIHRNNILNVFTEDYQKLNF